MGKKKQAQRTKNNVVPASSGRSAQLLQSTSGVHFGGFETLKEGGFIPLLTGISDELDVNINEDFRLVWKKMSKKDTTTKLKGLDELKRLCQECDVASVKPVLPFWPRVFCALSTDEEHRIREAAHAAHRALILKAGRNIAPFLKQFIGPWFTGQHDTYAPAASMAQVAFLEAFPPNKMIDAIIFCQDEIISYIADNLLNQTPQTLAPNQNITQEAKDARYQRVVVSCLNGYALYLQRLPTEHLRKAEEANQKLVSSAKFWKFNKDPAPIVRAAWFSALVALCDNAPWLLVCEVKHLCMAVFTNLGETDPSVVCSLWQAVLLTFTVVEDVWSHVSLEELVVPKLLKVLQKGASGSASLVYPHLLPLLSKLSVEKLSDKNKFYAKFFDSLRIGLKVRNVQISGTETTAVITAFLECLRYLINVNGDDNNLCLLLVEQQMFPLLDLVLTDPKLHLARPCLFSGVSSLVNYWSRQGALYSALAETHWTRLPALCQNLLEPHLCDATILASHCRALQALFSAYKQPYHQPRKTFKVKFVSPRKLSGDVDEGEVEDNDSFSVSEQPPAELAPSFVSARNELVGLQLRLCFMLLERCGESSRCVLVEYFAHIVQEYQSSWLFEQMLSTSREGKWLDLYQKHIAHWLRHDNIPLHTTLRLVFTLLGFVNDDSDEQTVFNDLSGDRWQEVVEWALRTENQTSIVCRWLLTREGLYRLASVVSESHSSYNTLHNFFWNIHRSGSWLSTEALGKLIQVLRHNISSPGADVSVSTASATFVSALLQNTVNHKLLVQLPSEDLTSLLYELFTGDVQQYCPKSQQKHFPRDSVWKQCLVISALHPATDLSVVLETCVDLLAAVVRTRPMELAQCQHLVYVLELLAHAVTGSMDVAEAVDIVLSRLSLVLSHESHSVWSVLAETYCVAGCLRDLALITGNKHTLATLPLQQYVSGMIPLVIMVVRIYTTHQEDHDLLDYTKLRATLPTNKLWEWTFQVLQLQCVCSSVSEFLTSTKQYFLLKDKVTYMLGQCNHLPRHLKIKDVIKHLDLSLFEEGSSSLRDNDPLHRLQTQVVLRDLSKLYPVSQVLDHLLPYKTKNYFVKYNFFPEEALEQLASSSTLQQNQLPVINTCCNRLAALYSDGSESHTNISILDRVFDHFVAKEKENRSLLQLSDEELHQITEVTDFAIHAVSHDSAHLQQSSWDTCLVATAALTLSIESTLADWSSKPAAPSPPTSDKPHAQTTSPQPWPLSLLLDNTDSAVEERKEKPLRLPLVRLMCSVCRLFDAVSAHMSAADPQDRAAATRAAEWADVFLPGTHAALTKAWLILADGPCESAARLLLVEALSNSVTRFVRYPHFVLSHDMLSTLDSCCRLLQSSQSMVQLTAYQLLLKLIPAMIELDVKQCEKDNVALSCQHVDKTLIYTQSIIDVILSGLSFGDLCTVEPFTDSYTYTRCYLLLWCTLLELCANACSQLRALYTTWLKEDYLPVFMKTVFCLMPEAAVHGEVTNQRIATLFSKLPELDKGVWDSERLAHLSCWVFARALHRLPAAMRQWWNEAEQRVHALVEHVTATYVSPDLCAEEMRAIQKEEKKFENMTVHVHPSTKEVYAIYTVEECHMELAIELAHNHPLGLVKVHSGQRMVSTAQTRQWLMQINILLTHQNGSIWDALELWKASLDKRFEGVEECYICFAILHTVSHQLPKLSCSTCRKKFHSHCLYKWFTTSNKSTCPICRNLF